MLLPFLMLTCRLWDLHPAFSLPTSSRSLTQSVVLINHTVYIVYRPMYILIAVVNMEGTNDLVLDIGFVT